MRTRPCVACGTLHEHGEPISIQDHELPAGWHDRAGDGRSLEQVGAEWRAQVAAERGAA